MNEKCLQLLFRNKKALSHNSVIERVTIVEKTLVDCLGTDDVAK